MDPDEDDTVDITVWGYSVVSEDGFSLINEGE